MNTYYAATTLPFLFVGLHVILHWNVTIRLLWSQQWAYRVGRIRLTTDRLTNQRRIIKIINNLNNPNYRLPVS
jgi:hypothetical protein